MKPFATDLDLPLETRKIELCIVEEIFAPTRYQQALNGLRQQKLMVKGHIRTPVLQRENNADSHTILIRVKNAFPLKNQTLRMAKLLKIR